MLTFPIGFNKAAAAGGGVSFSTATSGALAAWDITDTSSRYVARSATGPNAGNGELVGYLADQVGSNHLTAFNDAARPMLTDSGGLVYLSNDGSDDRGLSLSGNITVKEVVLAMQYKTGVETTSDNFHTLTTKLDEIQGDRMILNSGTANVYNAGTDLTNVAVQSGTFGEAILPLAFKIVRLKKPDGSNFPLARIAGRNGFSSPSTGREWPGRFVPIAAFTSLISNTQRDNIISWAASNLGTPA